MGIRGNRSLAKMQVELWFNGRHRQEKLEHPKSPGQDWRGRCPTPSVGGIKSFMQTSVKGKGEQSCKRS